MKEELKMVLVLTIVSLISAAALSFLYNKVKANIEMQEKAKIEDALKYVMPDADKFDKVENKEIEYWKVIDHKGEHQGYTFIAKRQGFSSIIKVMVGIDLNGKIKGMKVIAQQETPGLGANMELVESDKYIWDIFKGKKTDDDKGKEPFFLEQFKELNSKRLSVVKTEPDKENNEIEALTGATISSQAVVDGIEEVVKVILKAEENN